MKTNKFMVMLALVCSVSLVQAQKIVSVGGDIKALSGETKFSLRYDYSGMTVGKFSTEKAYVDYKKGEYAKKDPASADQWELGWKAAKEKYYQPKFEEVLNKYLGSSYSILPSNTSAKYTLTLKTTFIEPGYNIGISKMPAYINVEYIFTETANPGKVIAKLSASKIPGSQFGGYDFDASARISESYAKAGKILAGYMLKNLEK